MGKQFVTQGLSGEATYGKRDDDNLQTEAGRRPSEIKLAYERIETNFPKSTKSHTYMDVSIIELQTTIQEKDTRK